MPDRCDNAQVNVFGAHAGDPKSILFFEALGVDWLSCDPAQVPGAKVAAAQAHIDAVNSECNAPTTSTHA